MEENVVRIHDCAAVHRTRILCRIYCLLVPCLHLPSRQPLAQNRACKMYLPSASHRHPARTRICKIYWPSASTA
jgi:hypothetical protein